MANQIEYLTVYNAHTGSLLKVPKPLRFHTLVEFKTYLYEHFTNYIVGSTDNIFLLTTFGIRLNFSMINGMNDVYMFDKRLFVQGDYELIFEKYLLLSEQQLHEVLQPKPYEPSTIFQDDIVKIGSTLKVCEGWTRALVQNSHQINERIDQYIKQTNAIFMSLSILFEFITNYIRDIKKYFDNHQNHIKLLSMKSLHNSWKLHYGNLEKFPLFSLRMSPNSAIRLTNFLDTAELASSAAYVGKFLPVIVERFNSFSREVGRVNKEQLEIDKIIEHLRKESISQFKDFESSKTAFVAEVDKISKEIMDDTQGLNSSNTRQIYSRQIERGSQLFSEVDNRYRILKSIYNFKCKLGRDCVLIFEKLGSLQKIMVHIRNEIKGLMSDRVDEVIDLKSYGADMKIDSHTIARIQHAEEHLSMTIELPLLFGLMIIEKRRQYEWHNFFMQGVVHNTSEQLTMIIKHERDFQKLWIRKFGKIVKFIGPSNSYRIQLPSIDVTVVNGQAVARADSILAAIGDVEIDREDITRYIQMVRNHKSENNAAENLTKNYESLTVSTENLKQITKIIATLSSFASPNNLKMRLHRENGDKEENQRYDVEHDTDLNVINGMRSRIKCLESLLHQRQYQELLNWPVLKNSGGRSPDNRQSMLLLAPTRSNSGTAISDYNTSTQVRRSASGRSQTTEGNISKGLDASVTIDKHLDNIRLRRENSDLISTNGLLVRENESLQNQIVSLRKQLEEKDREKDLIKADFEDKFAITQSTIEGLGNRHEEELQELKEAKDGELSELQTENYSLRSEITDLKKSLKKYESERNHAAELDQEISNLAAELSDLKITNSELSSNLSAKEAELANERKDFELKAKDLTAQLERKNNEFAHVLEFKQSKQARLSTQLNILNEIVRKLLSYIEQLVKRNIEFFKEFCFVLESMGLLLVAEDDSDNHELKITRVKGLRTKKGAESLSEKTSKGRSTPHTEVYNQIVDLANWTKGVLKKANNLESTNSQLAPDEETEHYMVVAQQLLKLFAENFKETNGSSAFSKFMRGISFTENVQLQTQFSDVEVINQKFFLNGISKRFLDVEGFAKKLTKENKQKGHELEKWIELCNSKITVNNFATGDLALFLPIRIEGTQSPNELKESTPWTAFNIDSPHYLLDPENAQVNASKEWIVSRIEKITEHLVTDETVNDGKKNPFALSLGNTWFMIYTA